MHNDEISMINCDTFYLSRELHHQHKQMSLWFTLEIIQLATVLNALDSPSAKCFHFIKKKGRESSAVACSK
jgi:hypothetical protein